MPLIRAALLFACALGAGAQSDPLAGAIAALERGDPRSAEQILRTELRARPQNAVALGVLGVALDQQMKYDEAGEVYRRALALEPRSPALLNNYGNHLLAAGKPKEARGVFLRVLAANPAQANALVQLARLALDQKAPAEALRYLDRLPASAQRTTEIDVLRMQALYGVHRTREADAVLARVSAAAQTDPRLNYPLGVALASAGRYDKAEDFFSRAVEAAPDDFDALYHLGLAASHAGHNERARDILQSALRKQPQNVDVLYDLAAVHASLGERETAVQLLAEAARLAPDRADVQELLARVTADLGDFGDAVRSWDRYLQLVPGSDVARRERAFAKTANGEDTAAALADLRAFAAKYPQDAVGWYELGVAEAAKAPDDAIVRLDRAIALRPDLGAAHLARGLVYFRQARFAAALADFEFAARQEPRNPVVLDRLGQTYMALDRFKEAVPFLRRAAELAPRDSKVLLHLGRALTNSGQEQAAKEVFARVREIGPDRSTLPRPAGLVDFLGLSPREQLARYRAGVERTIQKNPGNAEAQVRWLRILLDDGNASQAAAVARRILELKPSEPLLAEAGDALLAAGQYATAREFLTEAAAAKPSAGLILDLAIATSRAVNAKAGLAQLDRIPPAQRTGDYYLARAELLEAAGETDRAAAALDSALEANPTRAELYRYAIGFLIGKSRFADAFALLDRGARVLPDQPEIPMLRAIALVAAARLEEAARLLETLQGRWPEWYKVWLAQGVLLAWQGQEQKAGQMVETAVALGAADGKDAFARAARAPGDPRERAATLIQVLFP